MPSDVSVLRVAIREAARRAFAQVRVAHPSDHFYYYALVTTGDALRPGPSASSIEGLDEACRKCRDAGHSCDPEDLRWSEADSPYNLCGDEHFREVEALFLEDGDHRDLPDEEYEAEVVRRYEAMEGAIVDLDREGFFGVGVERHAVVVNVIAPGEEWEEAILERAARLNPPESLRQIRLDLGVAG